MENLVLNMHSEVEQWDTKCVQTISRVYLKHYEHPQFIETLIELLSHPTTEVGSSWLLKHAIDEGDLVGSSLDQSLIESIYCSTPKFTRWETQLHILQIMEHIPIPPKGKKHAEKFVQMCFESEIKFVRAWAFSGYHAIALSFPELQSDALALFERMVDDPDEPASVKARIRKLIRKGFPAASE